MKVQVLLINGAFDTLRDADAIAVKDNIKYAIETGSRFTETKLSDGKVLIYNLDNIISVVIQEAKI